MKGFGAKFLHILRTEGIGSLVDRSHRYVKYRIKRARVDAAPVVADWQGLRGRYAGRRAFLIGNGPSLNKTELYLLRDEATMCFNRFDLMLERLAWFPTFYTTIDDRVLSDTVEIANKMSALSEHAFFPDLHPYDVDFRGLLEDRPNVHWLFLDRASFSDALPYCGINKTVANVGLQILAYLGFTEINLLGVDMTYALPASSDVSNSRDVTATEDDDENHFDPRYFGKGSKYHVPMLDETFAKFREGRSFFEKRGVRVRNATVGGVLEEFPRKGLDDILQLDWAEKRLRFEQTVRAKLRDHSLDPLEQLERASLVESPDDVCDDWDVFRAPCQIVDRLVMSHIFEFVPFGPLDGRHLWIRRGLLEPDVDERRTERAAH